MRSGIAQYLMTEKGIVRTGIQHLFKGVWLHIRTDFTVQVSHGRHMAFMDHHTTDLSGSTAGLIEGKAGLRGQQVFHSLSNPNVVGLRRFLTFAGSQARIILSAQAWTFRPLNETQPRAELEFPDHAPKQLLSFMQVMKRVKSWLVLSRSVDGQPEVSILIFVTV